MQFCCANNYFCVIKSFDHKNFIIYNYIDPNLGYSVNDEKKKKIFLPEKKNYIA